MGRERTNLLRLRFNLVRPSTNQYTDEIHLLFNTTIYDITWITGKLGIQIRNN